MRSSAASCFASVRIYRASWECRLWKANLVRRSPAFMYVSVPHLQRALLTLDAALWGAIADVAHDHPEHYFEEKDFGDQE